MYLFAQLSLYEVAMSCNSFFFFFKIFFFFKRRTIFKVFIEFVTILFLFSVLVFGL